MRTEGKEKRKGKEGKREIGMKKGKKKEKGKEAGGLHLAAACSGSEVQG